MDQVNSGKIEITAEQWLAFMYDDEMGLEADNDQYGLCHSEYLAHVHHQFPLHPHFSFFVDLLSHFHWPVVSHHSTAKRHQTLKITDTQADVCNGANDCLCSCSSKFTMHGRAATKFPTPLHQA